MLHGVCITQTNKYTARPEGQGGPYQILQLPAPDVVVFVERVLGGDGDETGDILLLSTDFRGCFVEDGGY